MEGYALKRALPKVTLNIRAHYGSSEPMILTVEASAPRLAVCNQGCLREDIGSL